MNKGSTFFADRDILVRMIWLPIFYKTVGTTIVESECKGEHD